MKDSKEATNVYRRDLQNHGKQTKQNDEKTNDILCTNTKKTREQRDSRYT